MKHTKHVLICEQSKTKLDRTSDTDDKYTFEGVFTQFGVENNNGRIYEEKEFLSHLEYLQEKINKNMLVGELDHPEKFDVQFSKASHMIEKLEYNKEKRQIVGRIKLLDTKNGKEAKALVDGGVQLSISSRAAGSVDENKKVHLKRIFTYDLVNDPGFETANLHRVTESLGFDDTSNIQIYEFVNTTLIEENENFLTKTIPNMSEISNGSLNESMEQITKNLESKLDRKIRDLVSEKFKSLEYKIDEQAQKLETTYDYIQEELQNNVDYMSMVAEHTENLIGFTNHIVETQSSLKNYMDASTDKINELVAENENIINYAEYAVENIQNTIDYSEHIMETVENSVGYAEHIMETVENSVGYAEHIMETVNNAVTFTEQIANEVDLLERHQDHFAETGNSLANFSTYLKDKLQEHINYTDEIAESVYGSVPNKTNSHLDKNSREFLSKIDELLNNAKKTEAQVDVFENYYNLLSSNKKNEFALLQSDQKEKIVSAVKSAKPLSEQEFINIWEQALAPVNVENVVEKLISEMPDEYKGVWESLSGEDKTRIVNQSAFYNLHDSYSTKNFWYTRKELNEMIDLQLLQKNPSNLITESNVANTQTTSANSLVDYCAARLSKRQF